MAYENIIAVYQSFSSANDAISELEAVGVGLSDINLHGPTAAAQTNEIRTRFQTGKLSEKDIDLYEKCVAKGWLVVTVTVQMERADTVMAILSRHAPVEIDDSVETYGSTQSSPSEKVQEGVDRRSSSLRNPSS